MHTVTTKRGEAERLVCMAADRAARIGRRIRELRIEKDWTQAKLAGELPEDSVTSTYVSRWERGEHEPLGDRLDMIASALGTTPEDLMAGPLAERKAKPAETPDLFADGASPADAGLYELVESLATTVLALRDQQRELADAVRRLSGEEPGERPGSP